MVSDTLFQFPLAEIFGECQEIEIIGVFDHLTGKVRLRGRKCFFKVGDCFAAAGKQITLNLMDQHAARPVVLDGFLDVENCLFYGAAFLENSNVMPPRYSDDLRSNLVFQL